MVKKAMVTLGLAVMFSAGYMAIRDVRGLARPVATAAPFSATTLDGGTVGPQTYAGKVVLVNFWATYCVPCVDEMPSLERIWKDYGEKGLVVLAVSIDDDVAPVRDFQKRFGISFPVAHDPGRQIAGAWGTAKVPETYIIARSGQVRTKVMGNIDWSEPGMRRMLEGMLKEPA